MSSEELLQTTKHIKENALKEKDSISDNAAKVTVEDFITSGVTSNDTHIIENMEDNIISTKYPEASSTSIIKGNVLQNYQDIDNEIKIETFTISQNNENDKSIKDSIIFNSGESVNISDVGTLTLNLDGSYIFIPVENYTDKIPTITYKTNKGITSTLNIIIDPIINNPTITVPDILAGDEDHSIIGNVLSNDRDIDDNLTIDTFIINGNRYDSGDTATILGVGAITLNIDGSYTFIPITNYNGEVPTITYTTNTGSSDILDITVNPINDAPILDNIPTQTIVEDGQLKIDFNMSDIENNDLTASVSATNGTALIDEQGQIVFTPDDNFYGDATVTLNVDDGNGGVTSQIFTVSVTSVNDTPIITVIDTTVIEDISQIIANVNDIDGEIDSSKLRAKHGTVVLEENGDIRYTPNLNYDGEDSVNISVTDDSGAKSTTKISIDIDSRADAPNISLTLGDEIQEDITTTFTSGDHSLLPNSSWTYDLENTAISFNFNINNFRDHKKNDMGGEVEVKAYDINDNLIGSQIYLPNSNNHEQFETFTNNDGFSQIVISTNNNADVIIEDVTAQIFTGESTFSYALDINTQLSDIDNSESLSNITLNNIPLNTTLEDINGDEITANINGTYSIDIDDNGDALVIIQSDQSIDESITDQIVASITSTEIDNDDSMTSLLAIGEEDIAIDFDTIVLDNVNSIDMNNLTDDIINLEKSDVLNMTDENNELTIFGSQTDSINLQNSDDNQWTQIDDEIIDGTSFIVLTDTEEELRVLIENDIGLTIG